jgi:zinc protease
MFNDKRTVIIYKIIAAIASCCIFFCPNALAQQPDNLSLSSYQRAVSTTEKTVLDNGLTILLKKVPGDVVSIVAFIKSGSAQEGKFLGTGIGHLTEHMLFKDNPEDPKSEIARRVSNLGGDINGSTSYDWTNYSITLPKENAIAALELLQRFLMNPRLRVLDLEKEKLVVLKEINLGKDNPSKTLWDILMKTAFKQHPYRYPIIGYEDLLKGISLRDLKEYYRQTYVPENIILSIAGDFDSWAMVAKIKELFEKNRRHSKPGACAIVEPPQIANRQIQQSLKNTNLAYATLAWRSVSVHDKDMFALDTLAGILAGGASSRLYQLLKERLQLVYSISASNYTPAGPGLFIISWTSEPQNLDKVHRIILEELEKIKKSGVSFAELKKSKQATKSSILFSQEDCENLAHSGAQYEAAIGNPDFDEQYIKNIEALNVPAIRDVAGKYLSADSHTYVSIIPDFTQGKINENPEPTEEQRAEIKKFRSNTGLRVLLLKDSRLPIVNIRIAFLGGLLSEPKEKNGICYLASTLFLKGTQAKNEYEISRLVESWGAVLSPFAGSNSFGLSLKTPKENLRPALALISEIVTKPAFSPAEIEKEKMFILAQLKQQKEDIFSQGMLLLKKEIYRNHPYAMNTLGSPSTINALSRDDIVKFYQKINGSNNIVISVFGDIDTGETLNLVNTYFRRLQPTKEKVYVVEKLEPLSQNITQFEILEKEQTIFMLGFPSCSLEHPDRYVLDILSQVLSGLDGRMFKRIRSKLGIAYALGAYNNDMLQGGHFMFYIATTQENINKTREKIWEEIARLKKYAITKEELERAKHSLVGNRKISLQSLDNLSWHATLDELYGLGLNNYQQFENNISKITIEDVRRVINNYFKDNYAEIFVGPSSQTASAEKLKEPYLARLQQILQRLLNTIKPQRRNPA